MNKRCEQALHDILATRKQEALYVSVGALERLSVYTAFVARLDAAPFPAPADLIGYMRGVQIFADRDLGGAVAEIRGADSVFTFEIADVFGEAR